MLTLKNYVAQDTEEAVCPPQDVYTLRLKEVSELEEKTSTPYAKFLDPNSDEPDDINTQSKFTFEIVDYDYDEDEDERDWNGLEIFDYPVFFRRKVGEPVDENRAVFKSERSAAYKMLTALGFDVDGGEDINVAGAVGRRIKATLKPKKSGWPKIDSPSKTRQKKAKAAPKPAPEEDDEEFWDGDE